jgi:hypothetical protein
MMDRRGTHPLAQYEHGHEDIICKKNCTDWVKLWLTWMLTQDSSKNPLLPQYAGPFEVDSSQGKDNASCDVDEEGNRNASVWFLAGPPYGASTGGTFSKWVVLPPTRKWHILASPFTSYVSKEEYPSLSANKLYEQAKKDVDSVYKIEGTLDGLDLAACRVPIKDPFPIENIPANNILGLSDSELTKCKNTLNMCSDGYTFWLRPLPPGLHLLHLLVYSRVYEFDVKFQLNVR